MRFLLGLILGLAWLTPVYASDAVDTGPVPSWVRPIAIPTTPVEPQGSVTYLLLDEQFDLQPGRLSTYSESAFRIETAEGLSAGNISLGWEPQTQKLIVHRLIIRRGDQIIDVLGSSQTFTVLRRESNLESAMLDGVLTANIQPEGLQVGDIVNLATTRISADPVFDHHVEQVTQLAYGVRIGRRHIRAQWPASLSVRLQQSADLPTLTSKRTGNLIEAELTSDGLDPVILTKSAPLRYRTPRVIEFSDFRDWSDLATLLTPLYDKAAALPVDGPLQAEINHIRAASHDPTTRAEAVLALVQGRVRYVALLMGSGSLTPTDAMSTWNRRFGDCKAKSALLIAMLRALDIPAEPVIVNTEAGDGIDRRLPMIGLFNHVIVRATIAGKSYWLDGTRTGDRRLDQLTTPDYGWGLPLTKGASLVRMEPERLALPETESTLRLDARGGITQPAPVHAEILFRGDDAYGMSVAAADLSADALDRGLRDYWKRRYSFVDVKATSQQYDSDRREMRLTMDGVATMDWSGGVYWLTDSGLGYAKTDFERGVQENREAPYAVNFPYYTRSVETILLPPRVVPDNADAALIAGGVEYRRKGKRDGDAFTVETTVRSLAPEFPAHEAPIAQKSIRALAERYPALRVSGDYYPTDAEKGHDLARAPATADEYADRGWLLLDDDHDATIAAFDASVRLDPRNAKALAGRGFARAYKGEPDAGLRDMEAAAAIDPDHGSVLRGLGYVAQMQKRYEDALRFYTQAIERDPDDGAALGWRAQVQRKLNDDDAALEDSIRALRTQPDWLPIYSLRASIFRAKGQPHKALAEAAAMLAANPQSSAAHEKAAEIYYLSGKRDEALGAMLRAIELKPSVDLYLRRAELHPFADITGTMADVDAALRLDPRQGNALRFKATLQRRAGDLPGAIATISTALQFAPADSDLLAMRGQANRLAGHQREAERDYGAARRAAKTSADFNNICWHKAVSGADLASALEDCDTALSKDPDGYMQLDSRGLVLLQLGQFDKAIDSYDRALKQEPNLAESLFGRAIAWSRKGDMAKAEADRAAAITLDPDVAESFRSYGLTL